MGIRLQGTVLDIRLRKALQADVPEIAQIHVDSWITAFAGLMPDKYINGYSCSSRIDEWDNVIKTNAETVVVAETDSKIVGFMSYSAHLHFSDTLELSKLYLCPSVYGKSLGSQLLTHLISEAETNNIKAINLYVLDNNESAIRFYKKHGFEYCDGYVSEEFEGETIIDVLMTKRISA